jgi:hypothetical protein
MITALLKNIKIENTQKVGRQAILKRRDSIRLRVEVVVVDL